MVVVHLVINFRTLTSIRVTPFLNVLCNVWVSSNAKIMGMWPSRFFFVKIWGFHGGDYEYEECCLLGYKNPVRTSQETHYVSATESNRLILCRISVFHGGTYGESRFLGCDSVALVRTDVSEVRITSFIRVKRIELGTTLTITSKWSTLILFTLRSTETTILTRATWCHIPEDGILYVLWVAYTAGVCNMPLTHSVH
jgi:hypothetical protein